jgi:hypothetical protein
MGEKGFDSIKQYLISEINKICVTGFSGEEKLLNAHEWMDDIFHKEHLEKIKFLKSTSDDEKTRYDVYSTVKDANIVRESPIFYIEAIDDEGIKVLCLKTNNAQEYLLKELYMNLEPLKIFLTSSIENYFSQI